MAREASVTQEQINAAADAIRASGAKPTARAVRDQIGSGSMATILRLLQNWQAGQIKPAEQAVTLPPALQRALVDFIGQEVATAKAGLEADVVGCQAAQADLIVESDRQASTIELQAEALEASQAAQAEQAGRMGQLESDLAKARDDAEQERMAAEAARTELAKAQLRLEAMPRIERDIEALREQLATEHQSRVTAEQTAAVATAELKGSERRVTDLGQRDAKGEERIAALIKAGEAAAADAKKTAQELATANGAIQTAQAKLDAAARELDETRKSIKATQEGAQKAGEEAAELRGQIKAARSEASEARVQAAELRGRLTTIEAQSLATA
jgi:chromosome segregation ATPase